MAQQDTAERRLAADADDQEHMDAAEAVAAELGVGLENVTTYGPGTLDETDQYVVRAVRPLQ